MTLATRDAFLKPIPLKDETVEIEGFGSIRIKQLSFSESSKLHAWLFPDGEPSKKRQFSYGLKMATASLVDGNGELMFKFPDTKKGNAEFFEFADPILAGGSGHWERIIEEVRRVNSQEETSGETLLGKSDS